MHLTVVRVITAVLLWLAPNLCRAQDFSADVLYSATKSPATSGSLSSAHTSKIFVSKDKIRLETRGVTGTVLLVDAGEHTTFALFPDHKMYQPLMNPPAEYFRVKDAENACPDWRRASIQEIVCEKVGHETVAGHDAVKYLNKRSAAETSPTAVWIDPALRFVIKWENTDTVAELQNIKEGAQTVDLFTVPSTYEPLKPMKKSPKSASK